MNPEGATVVNSSNQSTEQALLDEIVRRIVAVAAPSQVVLFGSRARGTADRESDVDLLVVVDATPSRRKTATELDLALVGIDVPIDLMVVTPADIRHAGLEISSVITPALREGRLLYDRAA